MYEDYHVLSGIVTYNPDIGRLKENLDALFKQVKNVLIIDNNSKNIDVIKGLIQDYKNYQVKIYYNKRNLGIATALHQIMEYAKKENYKWVLTLDQDSVIKPGLVENYIYYSEKENNKMTAMFSCLITDRNFNDKKYETQKKDIIDIPYCITSAAFTNVDKYKNTSGYDKKFFIDCVDVDICYQLREKGYKIKRIAFNGLYHEVGHGGNRHFLWKNIVVYNQKPFRAYYLARNTVWMWKKHSQSYSFCYMLKKLLAQILRIILYENQKIERCHNFVKGIYDSKKYYA